MVYTDDKTYSKCHVFSKEELIVLTPDDVYYWLANTAYGTPNPRKGVDHPTEGRSTLLEYNKKLSHFFIPYKHLGWNELSEVGNPIKSGSDLVLIKAVKKSEVRGEGTWVWLRLI